MKKKDMIALIKAVESFNRLNDRIGHITNGYHIDCDEYEGLYEIYEILRRNSRYPGTSDHDEDSFRAIIYAINKTPEEKYELLKRDEWNYYSDDIDDTDDIDGDDDEDDEEEDDDDGFDE